MKKDNKNNSIAPYILGLVPLSISTIACLSNLLSSELRNDLSDYVFIIYITIVLICVDIWFIKIIFDLIKARRKEQAKTKKSLISIIFSITYALFIILLIFPVVAFFILLIIKNLSVIHRIDAILSEYGLDIGDCFLYYFILLFGVGITATILKLFEWKKQ